MKKYNKLVRDKVPDVLKRKGKKYEAHVANDEEYWQTLKQKLLEETEEFLESEGEEEIADILDVLDEIFEFMGLKRKYIEFVRKQKAKEKGKFKKRIILEKAEV